LEQGLGTQFLAQITTYNKRSKQHLVGVKAALTPGLKKLKVGVVPQISPNFCNLSSKSEHSVKIFIKLCCKLELNAFEDVMLRKSPVMRLSFSQNWPK